MKLSEEVAKKVRDEILAKIEERLPDLDLHEWEINILVTVKLDGLIDLSD